MSATKIVIGGQEVPIGGTDLPQGGMAGQVLAKASVENYDVEWVDQNVYSAEETRIGTWIDGKPLYRRCKKIGKISGSAGSWIKVDDAPGNIETVVSITGGFYYLGDKSNRYIPLVLDPISIVNYTIKSGTICVYISAKDYIDNGDKYFYIIEYTKTTDNSSTTLTSDVPAVKSPSVEYLPSADQAFGSSAPDFPSVEYAPESDASAIGR